MKKFGSLLVFSVMLLAYGRVVLTVEWDPSSVKEFQGTILYVERNLAVFKTADGAQFELHLGPAPYLKKHGIVLLPGSKVSVKGMVLNVRDKYHLFAQRIKYGVKALNIRDKDGKPLWKLNLRRKVSD